jgi:hypothetical protein
MSGIKGPFSPEMLADLPPHVELPELGMVHGWLPERDLDELLRASELENHVDVRAANRLNVNSCLRLFEGFGELWNLPTPELKNT